MQVEKKQAMIITHVAFEGAGRLFPWLLSQGYEIREVDASTVDWTEISATASDLWVLMGGPLGVYETQAYPFLVHELSILQERLQAHRPTLGICLGAQLIAQAAGGHVYPGSAGAELGWGPLLPGRDAQRFSWWSIMVDESLQVLHWHGDTMDLPAGAQHLASSSRYENQAFMLGQYALGLQFHGEVTAIDLERWYVGHAKELSLAGVSIPALRQEGCQKTALLHDPFLKVMSAWLKQAYTGA
ncbi:MAG: glutamine amidotransferase [Pseudomonadales bacterium]|nr:glutamine amidotransferase [Pseudomonadales bacterium]